MVVRLHVPASDAFRTFADPQNMPKINPSVESLQILPGAKPGVIRIATDVKVCALFYCRVLHQVQDMTVTPLSNGGDMHADVLPDQSDFRYGRADWRFRSIGADTQLQFQAEMEPAFWIPPVLGTWVVEKSLRRQAEETGTGIERLAKRAAKP